MVLKYDSKEEVVSELKMVDFLYFILSLFSIFYLFYFYIFELRVGVNMMSQTVTLCDTLVT